MFQNNDIVLAGLTNSNSGNFGFIQILAQIINKISKVRQNEK
jgi:hypothetical protein